MRMKIRLAQIVLGLVFLSSLHANALIGGKEASKGMFPSQINFRAVTIACGGVKIGKQHILTAAHCVTGNQKNSLYLSGHSLQMRHTDDPSNLNSRFMVFKATVEQVHIHPSFVEELKKTDIKNGFQAAENSNVTDLAIIVFKGDLPISQAKMAKTTYIGRSQFMKVKMTGGGCTDPNGQPFSLTRYSEQKGVFDEGTVVKTWTDDLLSNGLKASGCYGDSGSPIYQDGKVVGVFRASSEIEFDGHANYNYFTLLDQDWIKSIINYTDSSPV